MRPIFERFTERARQVVVHAQDEVRELGHDYIGTEHILLGLLREEAAQDERILGNFDITIEKARAQVVVLVGQGASPRHTGQIPFTARAKMTLELALGQAVGLHHRSIRPAHILLGLLRANGGSIAIRVLRDLGGDPATIRTATVSRLGDEADEAPAQAVVEETATAVARPALLAARPEWEYEVAQTSELTSELLNARGQEGWELLAVVANTGDYRLIFKRWRPG
jgi:ATP-dependent Clp protease ATP-binding subunit ClpA